MNATESAVTQLQRAYRLTPRGRASRKALATRRANLEKARAAPREVLYRSTEKRRAASRANFQKAVAWRRSPEGNARARLNALKHGLYSIRFEDSLERLRENPREFRRHAELIERLFAPEDEKERRLLARLGEVTWRRLRLYRALLHWETRRLRALLAEAEPAKHLSPEDTQRRAHALVLVLSRWDMLLAEMYRLDAQMEGLLRRLIRRRSGGALRFQAFPRPRERVVTEMRSMTTSDFLDLILDLTPRRRAQVLRHLGATLARDAERAKSEDASRE